MANERLERFVALMRSIFELDKSDLDFGIYRIMNLRKAKIEEFLTVGLPKKVQETLAPFASNDAHEIKVQLAEIEASARQFGVADIATLPEDNSMRQKYQDLQRQLACGTDMAGLETDVYSALFSFFNRYYDEGDFISKRRYKEGVYAIPYEGEEVKLYWANQDQYYIKTSENFKDYTFIAEGVTVHFRLVDATTEQNNNKESDDSKRTFMLYTENEENPDIHTFDYDPEKRELIIRFVFDIPEDKKRKYKEENYAAIKQKIVADYEALMPILLTNTSTDPKKPRTLLMKHLDAYVAKNTFDYFIHKDLGGFLRRELDFYIKSEVMHLDDLDTDNEQRVNTYLAKVKAIKRVGHVIIDFLAQLEDFQKKLWLKKKFVVETNWCITLDHIGEEFWPEIIANKAQIQEWMDMYAINEAEGWTNPPSVDFLRQNQNLIVDTKHFSQVFRDKLVASIDDLDETTSGLLMHSDNFHALNLMQTKYKGAIKCTYIDPPYNAPESTVLYKNSFKHSAWLTLMAGRLELGKRLSTFDGSVVVAIDKYEHNNLFALMRSISPEHDLVSVAIEHNKKGTQGDHFSYSNEYAIFSVPMELKRLNEVTRPESDWEYSQFRNWGSESERADAANCFYPVYVCNNEVIGWGDVLDDQIHPSSPNETMHGTFEMYTFGQKDSVSVESNPDKKIIAVWPIDDSGVERKWRYAFQTIEEIFTYLRVDVSRTGTLQIKMPKYSDQFKTLWAASKYNAGDYGTKVLGSMGFSKEMFRFPKSVHTVYDCVFAVSDRNSIVLDYFAGSGTTAQAVMLLNRDGGKRKFILVEMGAYFDKVTKPRAMKSMYTPLLEGWDSGKPLIRSQGASGIIKYIRLESYEDALSNIELNTQQGDLLSGLFGDEYLIHYMMDFEASGSLLNVDAFKNPFEYRMKITENNEAKLRPVDVVETFNYLIGLSVVRQGTVDYFRTQPDPQGTYEGAVRLTKDSGGEYGFQQIEGTLPDGRKAMVIWRTVTSDLIKSNAALDAYFSKHRINPQDREYDVIYVNGDNNLENLRMADEQWKVVMTELEFKSKMFEEE